MSFLNSNSKSFQAVQKGEKQRKPDPLVAEITLKPNAKLMDYPRDKLKAEYDPLSPEARMLQMSMKFIPLRNNEPKPSDSPYLFKVTRLRDLPYTRSHKKEQINSRQCIPRPPLKPLPSPKDYETDSVPIVLSLRCPKNPTSLLRRAHQNFVISYVDFINNLQNNTNDDTSPTIARDTEGRELSISCAICCSLPPRPQEVEETPYDSHLLGKYEPPSDYAGPVAFFPDFASLFEDGNVPPGSTAGWMDTNGVFHPAEMGDALPPDAVIGYMKDGVFYPLMTVEEGVRKGVVGVRMANTNDIGHYADGDSRFAFSKITGYQDSNGRIHPITPQDKFGYVDENEEFHELPSGVAVPSAGVPAALIDGRIIRMGQSRPLAGKIPIGSIPGYVDQNRVFHELKAEDEIPQGGIAAYENGNQEVILLAIQETDWWNRVPEDAIGGYLDEFGNFNPLKKGEKIPPGGTPAYQTDDGKVVPMSTSDPGYEDSTGKFHYFTPETKFGYIDENGDFHELAPGEELPPGGIPAFMNKNGTIVPMSKSRSYPSDLSKLGYFGEEEGETEEYDSGRQEGNVLDDLEGGRRKSLPEGAISGYLDEAGNFHPLNKGDEIPTGGRPAYQTTDGTIVPIHAISGYLDEAGNFHPLNKGDEIPTGGKPAYQTADGTIIPIRTSVSGTDGAIAGYTDESGNFHALKEGENIPPGGKPAYQTADGKIIRASPPITAYQDSAGNVHYITPQTKFGYTDKNGGFHELAVGEASPPDGIPAVMEGDGRIIAMSNMRTSKDYIPIGSVSGFIDSKHDFHELKNEDKVPAGGIRSYKKQSKEIILLTDPQTDWWNNLPTNVIGGFIDEAGNFHPLEKGAKLPPGGTPAYQTEDGKVIGVRIIPAGSVTGWKDENGVFHELKDGEEIPSWGIPAYRTVDGVIVEDLADIYGWMDQESLKFHARKDGHTVSAGSFLIYQPLDETIPEGGRAAYRHANGEIELLAPGEKPPLGTMAGWIDEKGIFHHFMRKKRDDEHGDLRNGVELTDDELVRFESFKRHFGVQVELEVVRGSLDLGEVSRQSFRIYSHGGSVDIEEPQLPSTQAPPK